MSEIDQTSGLSFLSSFFEQDNLLLSSTTSGSVVAAAISSALETTAEDNSSTTCEPHPEDHHFYQQQETYQGSDYNNHIDNCFDTSFGDFVKESLVSTNNNQAPPQLQALHQSSHQPGPVFPVAPQRRYEDCYANGYHNDQFYGHEEQVKGKSESRGSYSTVVSTESSVVNHVSGDDKYRSSSTCFQFHEQTSFSSFLSSPSSSQMADKQDTSGGRFTDSKTSSGDKSDNRETYQVSHRKEKSATTDSREVDSGGGGDTPGGSVFKPSSKIIDLPEKNTLSSSFDRTQSSHHRHSHSIKKDSKIPVGIAVAWQRLVTTSSSSPATNTVTMTTKPDMISGGKHCKTKMNSPSSAGLKPPSRPSSASSLKSAARISRHEPLNFSQGYSSSHPNLSGVGLPNSDSDMLSSRPMSACGDPLGSGHSQVSFCPSPAPSPVLSRPLPSSSVPPNMGYPTGYSSQYLYQRAVAVSQYLEYSYGPAVAAAAGAAAAAAAQTTFAVPSPLVSSHHHHHSSLLQPSGHPYWGLENPPPPPVPLLSPGISPSPGIAPADYLQQQQMHLHNQHHLHQQQLMGSPQSKQVSSSVGPPPVAPSPYNPYLPFLYSQDAATAAALAASMHKSPYYDQYMNQQQDHLLHGNQGYVPQQTPHPASTIPTPPVSGGAGSSGSVNSCNNSVTSCNNSNSSLGNGNRGTNTGFDLFAVTGNNNNNNRSGSDSGGASASNNINTHRAIPMQVASPVSRTSGSLVSGEIRIETPTSSSTSFSSTSSSSTTTTAAAVTSSAFSSTTSQLSSHAGSSAGQSSGAGGTVPAGSSSPSLFLLHHQQQNPHLFTSSSAALSPKSLTSSTPSPVTVHDFNSGLNVVISSTTTSSNNSISSSSASHNSNMAAALRKTSTPSPISLTPTRALLSPFPPGSPYAAPNSPSPGPTQPGSYKDLILCNSSPGTRIKPIPINGHTKETHHSGGSLTTPPPLSSPLLSLAHHNNRRNNNKIYPPSTTSSNVPTPLSSPQSGGQKHDFKRLESLIERRDSESISPLVLYPQHSPATSTTSSMLDSADEQQLICKHDMKETEGNNIKADKTPVPEDESRSNDDDDDSRTFCISVKLENPVTADLKPVSQPGGNNDVNVDESLKVTPNPKKQHGGPPDGKICMKSDPNSGTDLPGESKGDEVKGLGTAGNDQNTDGGEIPIKSCDVDANNSTCDDTNNARVGGGDDGKGESRLLTKNQHGGQRNPAKTANSGSNNKDNNRENVAGNDVPEDNTLLKFRASDNRNCKDVKPCVDDDNYFKTASASHNMKDVSFTSGYCSSHEDTNERKVLVKGLSLLKTKGKAEKDERKKGALKLKKDKLTEKGGKLMSGDLTKDKVKKSKKATSLEFKTSPAKSKTVSDGKKTLKSAADNKKKDKKGKVIMEKPRTLSVSSDKVKKAVKPKPPKNVNSVTSGKVVTVKKIKNSGEKKPVKVTKKQEKPAKKQVKNGKMEKQGLLRIESKTQPPTENNSFISPQTTGVSAENIINSGNYPVNTSSDLGHQQQPLAVILHQPTSAIQSPSQVTFLITSPTADRASSGNSSPLRIPAYIPRSGIISSTAVVASADEIVGSESYSGPATLTLHRDVDALSSPHHSYYHTPAPPPAITIQYHHSAPATPMPMDAASPSSLDLLATVAQEFGSREDLGKRLSIDGGSSCNASSIGESPPMSPQKSPGSGYPHGHQLQHYSTTYSYTPTVVNFPDQKNVTGITTKPTSSVLLPLSPGKRPKSPKKQVKIVTNLFPEKDCSKKTKCGKTSNSISLKQASKRVSSLMKAGKKEKRTVSDSAATFANSPVVLLKIPQVPGLKKPVLKQPKVEKLKKESKPKKVKAAGTEETSKGKQVPDNASDKISKSIKLNKKTIKSVERDNEKIVVVLNKKGIMQTDKNKEKKKSSKKIDIPEGTSSKSLLCLSLPSSGEKKLKEKKKRKLSVESEKTSADPIITSSPQKERTSSFYNPPERISAFAKQAISRRSSTAGGGSLTPTKSAINTSTTVLIQNTQQQNAVFLPIRQEENPISPTIKMPQLTPFDVLTESSTTPTSTPSPKENSTAFSPNDLQTTEEKAVPQSLLPKMRLSSSSHLPPPLLIPSVGSGQAKDKDYCDDNARYLSCLEQDKKKTDNIVIRIRNRSPCSASSKVKSISKDRKDNGRLERKRKKDRTSNEDDCEKHKHKKKKRNTEEKKEKKKKKRKDKQIPKLVVTQQSSVTFSPLTPPLTAKYPSGESEDSGGRQRNSSGHRQSAFACLQVPQGSSTPCSSLASRRSTPISSATTEGDTETTTETENENDLNNVWVADPMFAVSAVKILESNQPTDVEESPPETDVSEDEEERCTLGRKREPETGSDINNLSKLSTTTPPLSPHHSIEQEGILEMKSQLKAFVHFKPNQMTSMKKGHHPIKPCLKLDPIVPSRSVCNDEEEVVVDDDEDFRLDMEVANITTQNAPSKKNGKSGGVATSCDEARPSTSSTTTEGSCKKQRKLSINRNSASYVHKSSEPGISQTKKPHGLSTKEIMSKVFSRKVSPELTVKERKFKNRRLSGCVPVPMPEVDADDEDDEEELLDIDDAPLRVPSKSHSSSSHHTNPRSAEIAMSAAAAAVVVNGGNTVPPISAQSAGCSLSSTSLAHFSLSSPLSPMKKPKKRSARSSTTSSCASTKSNSRGNKGQGGSGSVISATTRASASSSSATAVDETALPGKVELSSVDELVDEMRILTDIQGLFYTGRLNSLLPPDVYGVTLDNERGAPPHIIFSAEEVLEKCLREKKPQPEGLCSGLRICAYWSPQYSGLYPGRVSSDFSPKFDPETDLIPIEFDDGDTGMIKLKEIRLLSVNHPVREYDPNPLLTLEKKHRKRRHSSATGTSGGCTGDHEEPDCGEPYCAKMGKLEEDEEDNDEGEDDDSPAGTSGHHHTSKMLYWTWSGLGFKKPKSKKDRNKEFFHGIQRGNEVIKVGDAALFISTGNERPFIGRVERFWERKGKKMVNVRWFYHPEEVKASAKRLSNLKHPGALFESPHIDENDVQTIAKKCDVLPFPEFKQRLSGSSSGSMRGAKLSIKSSSKPRDMYYVAGFYDPYTYNLTLKDLK